MKPIEDFHREDKRETASSLHHFGMIRQEKGDYEEAEKFYKDSSEILKDLGDKLGVAISLHQLGMLQQNRT